MAVLRSLRSRPRGVSHETDSMRWDDDDWPENVRELQNLRCHSALQTSWDSISASIGVRRTQEQSVREDGAVAFVTKDHP